MTIASSLIAAAVTALVLAPVQPILNRPAVQTPIATRAVLEAVALAGARVVAVGEHGIILLSDDEGTTWHQAAVPLSVTLTAVTFADPLHGWAVGHYGVIVASTDGGQTWHKQLDGVQFSEIALKDARRRGAGDSALLRTAEGLVSDGPDKPFLAVAFRDAVNGIAVGAYGIAAQTADGGRHWTSLMARIPNSRGLHLYGILSSGRRMLLVGEQGLIVESRDAGNTFKQMPAPFRSTIFAVVSGTSGAVIGGLRGHMARLRGESGYQAIDAPADVAVTAMVGIRDGTLITTQAGQLWILPAEANHPVLLQTPPLAPLDGAVQLDDGSTIVVGMGGVAKIARGE